ncbi:MAG: hypothetical protein AAF560_22410, partial [Acidobacteriota bacterium]
MPPPTWRELVAVSVLLLLLLCVPYGNVVFFGKSLVISDNRSPLEPSYLGDYGPELVNPEVWRRQNLLATTNFHDPGAAAHQWEPGGEFLHKAIERGEWPWWDPYVGAGTPAMANMTQTFFFPPYLLMVALGNTSLLKNLYIFFLFWMAGLATHAFLRRHGIRCQASFFGAAIYMLSGAMTQHVGSFFGQTTACLPVVLLLTRWLLEAPRPSRIAALAVGYGATALSSFPPMLLPMFGFAAGYGLWMILATRRGTRARLRLAGAFGLGIALSLGLVAFYYLPIADLMADTPPQVEARYRTFGAASLQLIGLFTLLSPTLVDGTKIFIDSPMQGLMYRYEVLPFIGIVPILAALLVGIPATRLKRQLAAVTGCATLLLALKLLGVEPLHSLTQIGPLAQIRWVPYGGFMFSGFAAILAALGIERLADGRVSRAGAVLVALIGGCLLGGVYLLGQADGVLAHEHAEQWLTELRQGLLVAVLFGALLIAITVLRAKRHVPMLSILFLTGIWLLESWFNLAAPRQARLDVWQPEMLPEYVQYLQREAGYGRVFGPEFVFRPNVGSAVEVFDLRSMMAFNSHRTHRLFEHYSQPWKQEIFLVGSLAMPPEGVLDAANIELIIVRRGAGQMIHELKSRGHRRKYQKTRLWIFRRPSSPRYYFSSDYWVSDAETVFETLGSRQPSSQILLEQTPTFQPVPNVEGDPEVVVEHFGRNRTLLALKAPRPGLVYLSESHFRGWQAALNGEPTDILRANYAFRAVEVPAGDVQLELSY